MKLSRKFNTVVLQAIVIVAIVAVFILIPIQKSRVEGVNKKLIELMQVFISQDNTTIANAIFEGRGRSIDVRMAALKQLDNVTNAVVFNHKYQVISNTTSPLSIDILAPEFKLAAQHDFSSWTTSHTLWYLQSINLFDENIGFVLIEYSFADMNRKDYIAIAALTLVLFSIMAAALLALNRMVRKRVILPVNSLIENMSHIEDGHYGGQIDIVSNDEIGDLASKYNNMSRQILQTHNRVLSIGNMLENIIDSMPSILFSVDGDGIAMAWNAAAESFSGIVREDAVGNKYVTLLPLLCPYQQKIDTVILTRQSESIFEVEENNRYYNISVYPLLSTDSLGAVIRLDDVTEAKINEEQLYQSQKMETIGVLAGGLAHDFNNVLAGIIGTTSILKHKLSRGDIERDKLMAYINTIENSSDRAVGMVRQLLTISKKYEPTMTPLDLNTSLENVIAVCRNTFDKKITISVDYYPEPAYVTGDANQIEQVLLNICVNAAHAMTSMCEDEIWGGTLSAAIIKCEIESLDTIFDRIENEKLYELTIADTGVGIEQDHLKSIFDPFFSTKSHENGTGLGLSMAFRTLKKHNGHIDVCSEVGQGTVFKIYLPVLEDFSAINQNQHAEIEVQQGDNHILIIDDEHILRETARDMLQICGYKVSLAPGGREGLEALDTASRSVDLVILDMAMPEMSGKETFVKIKEKFPELKILLASGNSLDQRVADVMAMGVDGFIAKPFQMSPLAEKVKEILSS